MIKTQENKDKDSLTISLDKIDQMILSNLSKSEAENYIKAKKEMELLKISLDKTDQRILADLSLSEREKYIEVKKTIQVIRNELQDFLKTIGKTPEEFLKDITESREVLYKEWFGGKK